MALKVEAPTHVKLLPPDGKEVDSGKRNPLRTVLSLVCNGFRFPA